MELRRNLGGKGTVGLVHVIKLMPLVMTFDSQGTEGNFSATEVASSTKRNRRDQANRLYEILESLNLTFSESSGYRP